MKAVKNNKVYTVTEQEKAHYLALGFDIQDDNGDVLEHGKGKTVPYEQYEAVVKELSELKTKPDKEPDLFSEMTLEELKEHAEAYGIDLGRASSREGILEKIQAAKKE